MGVKSSATSTSLPVGLAAEAGQTMSLASAVAHLDAVSAGVCMETSSYSWGSPSLLQQQALYAQFLQLACALPQLQFAHISSLHAGRAAFFPGFMPPFAGVAPPCLSPSPAPCSPAAPEAIGQQAVKPISRSDAAVKAGLQSKKSAPGSKGKAKSGAAPTAIAAATQKVEADLQLEEICQLLGDDAFLENLPDDLSEGSNGSSATNDGRTASKTNSSSNNNDNGIFACNDFASAFDLDMDEVPMPAAAACAGGAWGPTAAAQPPAKAHSGDLNNMAASSPVRSTRSSRSMIRDVAKDAIGGAAAGTGAAGGGSGTKISLKVKGGVQKPSSGSKAGSVSKASQAAAAAAVAAPPAPAAGCIEDALTAADLSRLLGEDDNRIPDGWDLDIDFADPFSCSIGA